MSFITLPAADIQVGKPIDQELMQLIKDNFDDLNTRLTSLVSGSVPNGSFEVDSDNDGIPDNWLAYSYSGGSFALETADHAHGAKCMKFVQTTSAGGGYCDSDYVPCSTYGYVRVGAFLKASNAAMRNVLEILYYNSAKSYISTSTVYDSTANPTTWGEITRTVLPPANARFFKLRVFGGWPSAQTGTAYWDNIVADFSRLDNYFAQTSGTMTYAQSGTTLTVGSKTATPYQAVATVMDIDLIGGQAITATLNGCAKTCSITPPLGRWTAIATANWVDGYVDAEEGEHQGYWNIILLLLRQA